MFATVEYATYPRCFLSTIKNKVVFHSTMKNTKQFSALTTKIILKINQQQINNKSTTNQQ